MKRVGWGFVFALDIHHKSTVICTTPGSPILSKVCKHVKHRPLFSAKMVDYIDFIKHSKKIIKLFIEISCICFMRKSVTFPSIYILMRR